MAENNTTYFDAVFPHRRRNNRTMSECSDVSTSSETQGPIGIPMERQSSVAQAEGIAASQLSSSLGAKGGKVGTPEVMLYDKYLSKFFNPLHTVPYADHSPVAERQKGVLYDVDGKFGYTTYSETMGSYHPMIDIKKFTRKDIPE